jgi:hypothetical protein
MWKGGLASAEAFFSGGNGLLQARLAVGLGQVDPVYFRTRVSLPGLQETTKQEIVQVLVVEPHEGKFDALEFTFNLAGYFGEPQK